MTITARTTGDLYGYTVVEEEEYGVKSTSGVSEYAGTLISLDTTGGREYEEDLAEGSFKRDSAVGVSISAGYKATYKLHTSSDWESCIKRVVGDIGGIGTLRDIPSYTTSIRVASDEYLSWTGCKVDTLSLKSGAIGALIEASATVSAQYMAPPSSSLAFTDASGTAYTMTPAVKPDTVPLHDNTSWYWSDDSGSTWRSCDNKTWELTISRVFRQRQAVSEGCLWQQVSVRSRPSVRSRSRSPHFLCRKTGIP